MLDAKITHFLIALVRYVYTLKRLKSVGKQKNLQSLDCFAANGMFFLSHDQTLVLSQCHFVRKRIYKKNVMISFQSFTFVADYRKLCQ